MREPFSKWSAPSSSTIETLDRQPDHPGCRAPLLGPERPSDKSAVDEQIWSFSRNGVLLEIRRTPTTDGFLLGVNGDGPPRTYFFPELPRLERFQADFEKFLLGTGWTFLAFSPERRTGRERRNYSRLLTDRRRWWTDGVRTPLERMTREQDERERRLRRIRRPPR